ncbi:hypothetical protein OIE52_08985 [Streptomyces canus]|uniref:hypothetical protein n=1 Tax=Streptomyces canus TaxID=58343 RepID=UPI00324ABDB5
MHAVGRTERAEHRVPERMRGHEARRDPSTHQHRLSALSPVQWRPADSGHFHQRHGSDQRAAEDRGDGGRGAGGTEQ